ncbi:acetylxylan esterase [Candidatus Saganbacteria bacterium]|nr:acetylxylan esterase [Candidatus Saganbacteria bacterium]
MLFVIIWSLIFLGAGQAVFAAPELEKTWDFPSQPVAYEVGRSYFRNNIMVEEVYYSSREYRGQPTKIFGYFCYPKSRWKLPGLIISHGGGGTANLAGAIIWAKHGYAVLAIDLPGKGEKRWSSRSTGPNMDVPLLLRTEPNPIDNYLVHAVAAVRNGITFLAEREEVNPEKLGMVGVSWGGVITLLTNGQDKRLKTAVNIFGSGFISEGCTWQDRFTLKSTAELEKWETLIDPKNFLKTQNSPILFMTGTNDHCYYLPTFQKSYEEIIIQKKYILFSNGRHQFMPEMQAIVFRWLDNKLKKTGRTFPNVCVEELQRKGNRLIIPAIISADGNARAALYYSPGPLNRWTSRKWEAVKGFYEDGVWYFGLSTEKVNPEGVFYIQARDQWGGESASPVRSIIKILLPNGQVSYAFSAPIKKINVHELPLQVLGVNHLPAATKVSLARNKQSYQLVFPTVISSAN